MGVDGKDGGGETVPYVGADHSEGAPSELRSASFDGSGSSSGGEKLAYIRVGRSKHDKVREVRRASMVESLMHDSSNIFAKVSQLDICKRTRLHHSFLL